MLMYFTARPAPTLRTFPPLTSAPSTASTVVGLTSGSARQMSAFEIGVSEFMTMPSMRAAFVARPELTTAIHI